MGEAKQWHLSELIQVLEEAREKFGDMPLFVASVATKEEVLLTDVAVLSTEQGDYECMIEIE